MRGQGDPGHAEPGTRGALREDPAIEQGPLPVDLAADGRLAALPDLLDRVDAYIADGTIGGEQPNAADFQIATSIGLALTLDDLKPLIEPRPAAGLAKQKWPEELRVVADLPRTPSGKVRKTDLRAQLRAET